MYGLSTIQKINATAHPFNRFAAESMDPDTAEEIAVAHAKAQREAKDALATLGE